MEGSHQKFFFVIQTLMLFVATTVKCSEYFSIVGPKILRIDEAYKVAVTSHSSVNGSALNCTVWIEGSGYDGSDFEARENVSLPAGQTAIAKLRVRSP